MTSQKNELNIDDILKELGEYFEDSKNVKIKVDNNIITGAKSSIFKREIKVNDNISRMQKEQLKAVIAHELAHGWIASRKYWLRWLIYIVSAGIYLVCIVAFIAIVMVSLSSGIILNTVIIALVALNIISRLSARVMREIEYKCDRDATLAIRSTALANALNNFKIRSSLDNIENRMTIRVRILGLIADLIEQFFGYLHPSTYIRIEKIKTIKFDQ